MAFTRWSKFACFKKERNAGCGSHSSEADNFYSNASSEIEPLNKLCIIVKTPRPSWGLKNMVASYLALCLKLQETPFRFPEMSRESVTERNNIIA